MAALQVRPATILDVPAIAKVHERALEKFHDFYAAFYKNHPVESLPKSTFAAVNNPANIFLIALDGEAIVGFLRYHIADTVEEKKAVGLEGESVQAQAQPQPDFYERKDSLKELWTEFNADDDEKDALYDGTVKGKRHICKCTQTLTICKYCVNVRGFRYQVTHDRSGIPTPWYRRPSFSRSPHPVRS